MVEFHAGLAGIVVGDGLVEAVAQPLAADFEAVRIEHLRLRAFLVEAVQFQEARERAAGVVEKLQPVAELVETAEVLAGTVDVVDPVAAALVLDRRTHVDVVGCHDVGRAFERHRVVVAVGQADVGVTIFRRPHRVDLDETGIRVAPEQRPLRTLQHFDTLDVEQRQAAQHVALEEDIVEHHADRLRGVVVEVYVAEAAEVETRLGTAVRRLDVEARHPVRERANVLGGAEQVAYGLAGDGRYRCRHVFERLLALLCRHDDLVQDDALGAGRPGNQPGERHRHADCTEEQT